MAIHKITLVGANIDANIAVSGIFLYLFCYKNIIVLWSTRKKRLTDLFANRFLWLKKQWMDRGSRLFWSIQPINAIQGYKMILIKAIMCGYWVIFIKIWHGIPKDKIILSISHFLSVFFLFTFNMADNLTLVLFIIS